MHTVDSSQLSSGLVLAEDLVKDGVIIANKYKVLDNSSICNIQRSFDTCKVLSLSEIEPAVMHSDFFSSRYIDFLVSNFNLLFSSAFSSKEKFDNLSKYISSELSKNREVLFQLIRLRQNHVYTYEHSVNVALLGLEVGISLELSDKELHYLVVASILHDLGKLYIDNSILDKPDKLTDEEFEVIKKHPTIGLQSACTLQSLGYEILRPIQEHHEKLDGSGYPYKLEGGDIHPLSRVITVCDIFDAVTSKRSYHDASPLTDGAKIIYKEANCGKLDKDVVQGLIQQTVLFKEDTFVRLSNGACGFIVKGGTIKDRPIVYDSVNKKYYDLNELRHLSIVYTA